MDIEKQLCEPIYSFISDENRAFIASFCSNMESAGYTCGDKISDGICWGRYMLIFTKKNVKSKKVYARIYIRENSISLRFFLSDVTKHSAYILKAPEYIRDAFTSEHGKCSHCRGDICKFRKCYTIGGSDYEKCNGVTFEFFEPSVERLNEYMKLFAEFYSVKK